MRHRDVPVRTENEDELIIASHLSAIARSITSFGLSRSNFRRPLDPPCEPGNERARAAWCDSRLSRVSLLAERAVDMNLARRGADMLAF